MLTLQNNFILNFVPIIFGLFLLISLNAYVLLSSSELIFKRSMPGLEKRDCYLNRWSMFTSYTDHKKKNNNKNLAWLYAWNKRKTDISVNLKWNLAVLTKKNVLLWFFSTNITFLKPILSVFKYNWRIWNKLQCNRLFYV